MTKKISEDTAEYYRVNLTNIEPIDRAKFIVFHQSNREYEFSNDEMMSLESGIVPNFMLLHYDKLLMDECLERNN